jgi:hypothetical protein
MCASDRNIKLQNPTALPLCSHISAVGSPTSSHLASLRLRVEISVTPPLPSGSSRHDAQMWATEYADGCTSR